MAYDKNYFQPERMESMYLQSDLFSVIFEDATGDAAEVKDGTFVTLGGFATDAVYTSLYTAAKAPLDKFTRKATEADDGTDGYYVVDLANVATKSGMGNTIRDGFKTIGLTAEAGEPVRVRKIVKDDTFVVGADNFNAVPTKGQWATVVDGVLAPSATAPTGEDGFLVVDSYVVSQGVDGDTTKGGVQSYRLLAL